MQKMEEISLSLLDSLKELLPVGLHMQTSLQNLPYRCEWHLQLTSGLANELLRTEY